jgi:hypothetical protein
VQVDALTLHTLVGTLNGTLNLYLGGRRPRPLRWVIGPVSEQRLTYVGPGAPPMLQLTDSQQCALTIQPVDKKGQPAQVDVASAMWTSSNPDVAAVNSNGLRATVVAGMPGMAQINVTVDADLGEGVRELSGTLDVTVVAGDAVSLGIQTEPPVEQP